MTVRVERIPSPGQRAAFWSYRQNNSGGYFTGPCITLIVEATSPDDADHRAKMAGAYFGGGGDCPCCGDRWSTTYGKGDPEPLIYDQPIADYLAEMKMGWGTEEIPEVMVVRMDGSKEIYRPGEAA